MEAQAATCAGQPERHRPHSGSHQGETRFALGRYPSRMDALETSALGLLPGIVCQVLSLGDASDVSLQR